MKYIIDANFFIKAHRSHYAFDIIPVFWDVFASFCIENDIRLIQPVYDELTGSEDVLSDWSKENFSKNCLKVKTTSKVTENYAKIMRWAYSKEFFDTAKERFANSADPWLVAYALEHDAVVITNEKSAPGAKKDIKLADVCKQFSVEYMDDISFLRAINFKIS